MTMWRRVVLTGMWLMPSMVLAEAPPTTAGLVVDVTTHGPSWSARAFEQLLLQSLSEFGRLRAVEHATAVDCDNRDCLLLRYGEQGADIVFFGELRGDNLHFTIYETWTRSPVSRGRIHTERGPTVVRQEAITALKPFLESGGLLDEKPFLQQKGRSRADSTTERPRLLWLGTWVVLLALFVIPFLLRFVRRHPARRASSKSGRWVLLVATILIAAFVLEYIRFDVGGFVDQHVGWLTLERLFALFGGIGWGALLLLTMHFAFPKLPGLERIRHHNVGRMLKIWLWISTQRSLLLALLFLPAILVVAIMTHLLALSVDAMLLVWAPAVGLLTILGYLVLADTLSLFLDTSLVEGAATVHNPWHTHSRKYFMGYVRRLGLDVDVARTLFLPGREGGILTYGGGLARRRITIEASFLEMALGPCDERTPAERGDVASVEPDAWARGLVSPSLEEKPGSSWRQRLRSERQRKRRAKRAVRRRYAPPRLMGENATLLGAVAPRFVDETVPLIANHREDLGVVRQLLTEHYAVFESGRMDEEYDDTDPTQKDLLFGGMLRELGAAERGDSIFWSLVLGIDVLLTPLARLRHWLRSAGRLTQRLLARYPAALGDAYAALHLARDHLNQYLAYQAGDRGDLTARADPPHLMRATSRILERVAGSKGLDTDPSVRMRLIDLSHFFHQPLAEPRRFRLGAFVVAIVAIAALVWLGAAVSESVAYSDTYAARMDEMQKRVEQSQKEGSAHE